MAAKPVDLTRPKIYLDQSTLSDAFRSAHEPECRQWTSLREWVDTAANTANLCVSTMHLAEAGRWRSEVKRAAFLEWLDSLPVVWMRASREQAELEDEAVLAEAFGFAEPTPSPFVSSMLSSFREMTPAFTAVVLAAQRPLHVLADAYAEKGSQKETSLYVGLAVKLRQSELFAIRNGWSDEQRTADVAFKVMTQRANYAREASDRLSARHEAYRRLPKDTEEVVARYQFAYQHSPARLRTRHFRDAFNAEVVRRIRTRFPVAGLEFDNPRITQPSKNEVDSLLRGLLYDTEHLSLGGPWCEVFTCDKEIDDALGDQREKLGLPRQLSVGRLGQEAFITALTGVKL